MNHHTLFIIAIVCLVSVECVVWADNDDEATQTLQEICQADLVYRQEKGEQL